MKVYRISVSETIALSITFGNMVRYLDGDGEHPTTSHVLVTFHSEKDESVKNFVQISSIILKILKKN